MFFFIELTSRTVRQSWLGARARNGLGKEAGYISNQILLLLQKKQAPALQPAKQPTGNLGTSYARVTAAAPETTLLSSLSPGRSRSREAPSSPSTTPMTKGHYPAPPGYPAPGNSPNDWQYLQMANRAVRKYQKGPG